MNYAPTLPTPTRADGTAEAALKAWREAVAPSLPLPGLRSLSSKLSSLNSGIRTAVFDEDAIVNDDPFGDCQRAVRGGGCILWALRHGGTTEADVMPRAVQIVTEPGVRGFCRWCASVTPGDLADVLAPEVAASVAEAEAAARCHTPHHLYRRYRALEKSGVKFFHEYTPPTLETADVNTLRSWKWQNIRDMKRAKTAGDYWMMDVCHNWDAAISRRLEAIRGGIGRGD